MNIQKLNIHKLKFRNERLNFKTRLNITQCAVQEPCTFGLDRTSAFGMGSLPGIPVTLRCAAPTAEEPAWGRLGARLVVEDALLGPASLGRSGGEESAEGAP
jgi:hypothetical protein